MLPDSAPSHQSPDAVNVLRLQLRRRPIRDERIGVVVIRNELGVEVGFVDDVDAVADVIMLVDAAAVPA
jgi:hypothetical protein